MNAQVRKFTAKRIFLLLEILSQVFDRLRLRPQCISRLAMRLNNIFFI